MAKQNRYCGYCGKPKCRCTYRAGRAGASCITMSNISAQTTKAEMLAAIANYFQANPEAKGFWSVSFTYQDEAMVAKTREKFLAGEAGKEVGK